MNRIKQFFIGLLVLSFALYHGSCKTQNNKVDKIVKDFEVELKLLSKNDNIVSGNDYKEFLIGVSNMTIPREFFTSTAKTEKANKFKKSDLFSSIWEKNSIIKKRSQNENELIVEPPRTAGKDNNQARPDYYQVNPNSAFMNGLIENTKNAEVKSLLKKVQKFGGLSPIIIANALLEINEFEDESVKKYIVVQFYIDYIFMMNRINLIN